MGVQARLARAIRNAPKHTSSPPAPTGLRPTGCSFSSHSAPQTSSTISIFTHQGATWSTNFQHYLTALPYPSTPENVSAALEQVPDAIHQQEMLHYGLDRWNPARINAEISEAATWAKKWGAPDLQRIWRLPPHRDAPGS